MNAAAPPLPANRAARRRARDLIGLNSPHGDGVNFVNFRAPSHGRSGFFAAAERDIAPHHQRHQLGGLILDLPAAAQQRIAGREQRDVDHQQGNCPDHHRRIGLSQEAVAEARDDIEERVGVADRLDRKSVV